MRVDFVLKSKLYQIKMEMAKVEENILCKDLFAILKAHQFK